MFLPDHVFEYLLIARPPSEIWTLIQKEKDAFANNHNHAIAAKTQPHITIANFLGAEGMESTLCRWFQNLFSLHTSFDVELDGYGGFPSHTIYLRIKNEMLFQQLAKQLKPMADIFKEHDYPPF